MTDENKKIKFNDIMSFVSIKNSDQKLETIESKPAEQPKPAEHPKPVEKKHEAKIFKDKKTNVNPVSEEELRAAILTIKAKKKQAEQEAALRKNNNSTDPWLRGLR